MKQILLLAFMLLNFTTFAQNARKGTDGNFYAIKSSKTTSKAATLTSKYYFDSKGVKYSVYVTEKGKYYVLRTSKKTGKEYKQYLKTE